MFEGFRLRPDMPPFWMLGFGALAWAAARLIPLWQFDIQPVGRVLGALGLALILWSAVWFWRKKTPIEPGHVPAALIVEGPYRLNRNPIYTGLCLLLLGYALGLGALSALVPAVLFPLLLTARFVTPEEAALRRAFGDAADVYFRTTRRW
ncbi:MAG: methyltransferase [Pseudomonadota bacterium]